MPVSKDWECTNCGTTNDELEERCRKCGMYKDEDPEEFQAAQEEE